MRHSLLALSLIAVLAGCQPSTTPAATDNPAATTTVDAQGEADQADEEERHEDPVHYEATEARPQYEPPRLDSARHEGWDAGFAEDTLTGAEPSPSFLIFDLDTLAGRKSAAISPPVIRTRPAVLRSST